MEWNFLILIGFALRIAYAIVNENYAFNFKTTEGVLNIRRKIVSALFVGLFYYLSFFYHNDDKVVDGWQLIVLWGIYIVIGWAIDSVWIAFVSFFEQKVITKFKS